MILKWFKIYYISLKTDISFWYGPKWLTFPIHSNRHCTGSNSVKLAAALLSNCFTNKSFWDVCKTVWYESMYAERLAFAASYRNVAVVQPAKQNRQNLFHGAEFLIDVFYAYKDYHKYQHFFLRMILWTSRQVIYCWRMPLILAITTTRIYICQRTADVQGRIC